MMKILLFLIGCCFSCISIANDLNKNINHLESKLESQSVQALQFKALSSFIAATKRAFSPGKNTSTTKNISPVNPPIVSAIKIGSPAKTQRKSFSVQFDAETLKKSDSIQNNAKTVTSNDSVLSLQFPSGVRARSISNASDNDFGQFDSLETPTSIRSNQIIHDKNSYSLLSRLRRECSSSYSELKRINGSKDSLSDCGISDDSPSTTPNSSPVKDNLGFHRAASGSSSCFVEDYPLSPTKDSFGRLPKFYKAGNGSSGCIVPDEPSSSPTKDNLRAAKFPKFNRAESGSSNCFVPDEPSTPAKD